MDIAEPEVLISKILAYGKRKYVKGTILVAKEGFNGTISGDDTNVDSVFEELVKSCGVEMREVMLKKNFCKLHPFDKLKVRLKKEIISMRVGEMDINKFKGLYIEPKDWDEFIQRDDMVLIDTRNDYEVESGIFERAIDPNIKYFRQFAGWIEDNKEIFKDKKIAMYCTGGVRCEKTTAYMRIKGYEEVYHLKGGILQYLEDTGNPNKVWKGDCYVFDNRVCVKDDLSPLELI